MKIKPIIAVLISLGLAVSVPHAAFAAETSTSSDNEIAMCSLDSSKNGLVKSGSTYYFYIDGKKLRNTWKTLSGSKYYFTKNGKAATGSCKIKGSYYIFSSSGKLQSSKKPKVKTVGKSKYIYGMDGMAQIGWQVVSGKLYYASKTGKCAASKVVDKIPLSSKCYAKPSNVRTKLMIESLNVISKVTTDKMTRFQKLEACWKYVNSFRWRHEMFPNKRKKDWQLQFAYDDLKNKLHNCCGLTASFCALAKALGEDPYMCTRGKEHMWTRINGKYWDNVNKVKAGNQGYWPEVKSLSLRFW